MAAPQQREIVRRLWRLARVPRERATRVREVIHCRWREELRRTRWRFFLVFSGVALLAAMIVASVLLWVRFRAG